MRIHFSTTAVFPAIRCRCGRSFSSAPFLRAFWTALPFCPFSTTAAFPMIRCRCGATFSSAPFPLLPKELSKSLSHLPKVCRFSAFPSHLPKVRKSRIASKRSVVAFVPFMISYPSEGAGRNGILPPPSHFRYVPGETVYCHHLLIFVMCQSASEMVLGGPAMVPCREGADKGGISPSPSWFRYRPTCLGGHSRRPSLECPSGRCRGKGGLSTTFSISLCVNRCQSRS